MKRVLILLTLCLFATGVAIAEPAGDAKALSVRTFQFKYKDADRAAAIIKPLMSAEGSMSIQPASNSLVVTDRAENVKAIANALASFDTAPHPVKLSLRLVGAGRSDTPTKVTPEMREVAGKLAVLRYNAIENLGDANVEGHEGQPTTIDLQNGYRVDFKFGEYDPSSDSIKLDDFRLSKVQNDQLNQVYKATLNLKVGQTLIFGATKTQGQRAIFLVFNARR
ncbi:MAG TPA: secretin N-terminal domain-containing protein [Thermoanaerobaculia bacterium]